MPSIQRLLELPPRARLFMCHDYAPGGRAYAFHTTVAKERAQNVHIHAGVTEDADTPRLFLPSLQLNMRAGELPPPESNGRRYFNCMIPGDPSYGSVRRASAREQDRQAGTIVFAWTLRRDQGNKAVAFWRRIAGNKSCLFAEGWPSGLRQRS